MKKMIALVMLALSFNSCSDGFDQTEVDCGAVTDVVFEDFNFCGELKEKPTQPSFIFINSVEDFEKFLVACPSFKALDLPDFTQKRILVLMAGPKPTGGYEINIKAVRQNNCQIGVDYTEKEPGSDEIVTQATSYPVDFVVMPKSTKPIYFFKVKETTATVFNSVEVFSGAIGSEFLEFNLDK